MELAQVHLHLGQGDRGRRVGEAGRREGDAGQREGEMGQEEEDGERW